MNALTASAPSGRLPVCAAPINLASVDLNLLVALNALLDHCNVTHAAGTVGLSQPAMSRALSRLRGMFDDDLLVRTSAGYVRTIRGEWLHDRLPTTLDGIRRIVSPRVVEAEEWHSTVRLAMPDHQALVLGKPMIERLAGSPKNREIVIEPLAPNTLKRLELGELEMVVGQVSSAATGFYQRVLYIDDYVCLVRSGHPVASEDWTPAIFRALQHAIGTPTHDGEPDHVADALMEVPQRNHCVVSPNMMGAAMAVAESDMVLTVPRRVAAKLEKILPLRIATPPVPINPYKVMLLWHERSHRNAEHEWARLQIAAAAASSTPSAIASPEPGLGIAMPFKG